MDYHAVDYYRAYSEEEAPHAHFHRVIALHDSPLIDWKEAFELAPRLCRGWYELAQLATPDRIELMRDFWLAKLPYHPSLSDFLITFFASLDDIGVFMTQRTYDEPFEADLVYSLSDNSGFFHGHPPAKEAEIISLQKDFPDYMLPIDYLAFLQIHNGFAKLTDTGIMPSGVLRETYDHFQSSLEKREPLVTNQGVEINPASLIPFYKSFGLPFYQCFWGEWYPEQEMGNIYYSDAIKIISPCLQKSDCIETMAFETFTDWLMFYLEKVD